MSAKFGLILAGLKPKIRRRGALLRRMSSESKVEFLRKLVKVKDGLASDVVEKSESKGRSRRSES
ncbi:hypothetical protein YC2023_096491 [Brassica napus]